MCFNFFTRQRNERALEEAHIAFKKEWAKLPIDSDLNNAIRWDETRQKIVAFINSNATDADKLVALNRVNDILKSQTTIPAQFRKPITDKMLDTMIFSLENAVTVRTADDQARVGRELYDEILLGEHNQLLGDRVDEVLNSFHNCLLMLSAKELSPARKEAIMRSINELPDKMRTAIDVEEIVNSIRAIYNEIVHSKDSSIEDFYARRIKDYDDFSNQIGSIENGLKLIRAKYKKQLDVAQANLNRIMDIVAEECAKGHEEQGALMEPDIVILDEHIASLQAEHNMVSGRQRQLANLEVSLRRLSIQGVNVSSSLVAPYLKNKTLLEILKNFDTIQAMIESLVDENISVPTSVRPEPSLTMSPEMKKRVQDHMKQRQKAEELDTSASTENPKVTH